MGITKPADWDDQPKTTVKYAVEDWWDTKVVGTHLLELFYETFLEFKHEHYKELDEMSRARICELFYSVLQYTERSTRPVSCEVCGDRHRVKVHAADPKITVWIDCPRCRLGL